MAKFKEVLKKPFRAIIENPTIKKIAENRAITGVVIPATTATIGTTLAIKRINDMKKQHKEDMEEYKKLSKKIDEISDKLENESNFQKEKPSRLFKKFKKKQFSIEGGGFKQPSPRSIASEGLKKIAEDSKYRSLDLSDQSLIESVRNSGDENCTIGQRPENTSARISAYQKGDVIVFMIRYLSYNEMNKLSAIFDAYCRTFKNTDYSSEVSSEGTGFIELWVANNSLDYLVKQLVTNGFSINVVL